MHWQAHGLCYGIGRGIEDDLSAGRVVVCNVSRAIIAAARERYRGVIAIYIDAQPNVRSARIAARGRDAAAGSRIDPPRPEIGPKDCDVVIDNPGALATAIDAFVQALVANAGRDGRARV
jgi:ribose 1,5-bisphosphokinase